MFWDSGICALIYVVLVVIGLLVWVKWGGGSQVFKTNGPTSSEFKAACFWLISLLLMLLMARIDAVHLQISREAADILIVMIKMTGWVTVAYIVGRSLIKTFKYMPDPD